MYLYLFEIRVMQFHSEMISNYLHLTYLQTNSMALDLLRLSQLISIKRATAQNAKSMQTCLEFN